MHVLVGVTSGVEMHESLPCGYMGVREAMSLQSSGTSEPEVLGGVLSLLQAGTDRTAAATLTVPCAVLMLRSGEHALQAHMVSETSLRVMLCDALRFRSWACDRRGAQHK
mgnify:CR=1 FL=1